MVSISLNLHCTRGFTQGGKSCKGIVCGFVRLILTATFFLPISLFIRYYVFSLLFPFFTLLCFWPKKSADILTCARLPSSALFKNFHGEKGAGWKGENAYSLPRCPPCLLSFTSTSCSLHSHHADLHSPRCFFSIDFTFFLPPFLIVPFLSFCRRLSTCTIRWYQPFWWKYLLNESQKVSNCERIVTARSI